MIEIKAICEECGKQVNSPDQANITQAFTILKGWGYDNERIICPRCREKGD